MKAAFFRVGFLALLLASQASALALTQHDITIEVGEDGYALVTERFLFSFNSTSELISFRNRAQALGASLEAWSAYDSRITNYIGEIQSGTGRIGYEEKEGDRQVKLEYKTKNPLFNKTETNRATQYSIDSGSFTAFLQQSVFVIPTNTKITFHLPQQANLDLESLQPTIENPDDLLRAQQQKLIYWSGHQSISGNLGLSFSIEKQIAPIVSLSQMLQQLVESGEASILAALILVLLGLAYFKRKSIQAKVEQYLIDHSMLEHQKETEEIELEE